MKRERKCLECGGVVRAIAKAGRTMPYRNVPALEVPKDFVMPACQKCGEVYLNAKDSQRLDEVLERSYRALLTAVVSEALRRLAEVVSKQELEIVLGVSQGYLSKLPEKQTSPVLVNLLALLADNPERGLKIMQAVWTSGAEGSAE